MLRYRTNAIDLTARRYELSPTLAPLYRGPSTGSQRCDVATVGGGAVLIDHRTALVEVGPALPRDERYAPWQRWELELEAVGWSTQDALVLATPAGEVFTWRPGSPPSPWWRCPWVGDHIVYQVAPDTALVVQHLGEERASSGVFRVDRAEPLWQRTAGVYDVLPYEGTLIVRWLGSSERLSRIDAQQGSILWEVELADPGDSIEAVVGDALWMSGERVLRELSLETGELRREIALESVTFPQGTLDDAGIYHVCSGLVRQAFDLRAGGARRSFLRHPFRSDGPQGARPGLPCADGRLVFNDKGGAIWVFHPEPERAPELVFRAPSSLVTFTIAHQRLYVVDERRTLHVFGDPGA